MSKTKLAVIAVAGAAVVAAACFGIVRYRDHKRACADCCAVLCLQAYDRIVGDGRQAVAAETLGPILDEMAALSSECSDDFTEILFARRLDGAFLVGNYALAEKMMDDMPGKSANWKDGAKAKIRAHAALECGDKAAAIGEFEIFCGSLLREDPNLCEYDPSNGVGWSKEALLARNMKRMGELAADIGDKERSAKFLSEACAYAKTALQKAEGDEEGTRAMLDAFGSLLK